MQSLLPLQFLIAFIHLQEVNYNENKDNNKGYCSNYVIVTEETEREHETLKNISFSQADHLIIENIWIICCEPQRTNRTNKEI